MGRKAAELVGAVSGDTYVKLDHGILTVNQIDMFLKAMPFELTLQMITINSCTLITHTKTQIQCLVNVYVLNQEID